jgi:hypothetical protein
MVWNVRVKAFGYTKYVNNQKSIFYYNSLIVKIRIMLFLACLVVYV